MLTSFFPSLILGDVRDMSSQKNEPIIKQFNTPSPIDLLVDDKNDQYYLIQINLINDSLHSRLSNYMPELDLNVGAASYQRILKDNHYNKIKSIISKEFYRTIEFPYNINRQSRSYWVKVKDGDETQGTWSSDEAIEYTCACLDGADGCVKLGWDEDWWNPLDYYGEAWWGFSPPFYEQIEQIRVTIRGAQCDDLPLWSETYMGMRNDEGGWSDDYLLSIDYTDNVFIVPSTWSENMLMPIIGSEDNYTIDQVKLEFFYSCNTPQNPSNMQASDSQDCNFVYLDWDKSTSSNVIHQLLFRDDQVIAQLEPNISNFQDSGATSGEIHAYCIQSINSCGSSSVICDTGATDSNPAEPNNVFSSDGQYTDQIVTTWQSSQGANQYKIYRDNSWVGVDNSEPYEFIDIFVDINQTYTYCIEAINDCGESSFSCDSGFSTYALGDVNFDNILNILDIVLIVNHILEVSILNFDQLALSDINNDGEINVIDVVVLISTILN